MDVVIKIKGNNKSIITIIIYYKKINIINNLPNNFNISINNNLKLDLVWQIELIHI